jgi:hypothetical protein
MSRWIHDSHSGGIKISPANQTMFLQKAEAFARTRPWFSHYKLKLRFKNQFCYLNGIKIGEKEAFPLGRLRYFRENIWSFAFYTYSNERYQPCYFPDGELEGSLEEGVLACEIYLL